MALDLFFPSMLDSSPEWQQQLTRASNPTDIEETKDAFIFTLEAPGFKPDEIAVDLKQDHLNIAGARTEAVDATGAGGKVIRRERRQREFSRTFTLPANVVADEVSASLEHGLLRVTVPKDVKQQASRRIKINAS